MHFCRPTRGWKPRRNKFDPKIWPGEKGCQSVPFLIPKCYRPIRARTVAKAMLRIAEQDPAGNRILTSANIAGLAGV